MLTVIRTKEGKSRWLTTSSTYFKDRDKEIVSEKALAADVDRADADGDYGPLRWWHVKGLDIGSCDFNEVRDGMLIESGTFHNEAIARAVEKEAPNLGVSIGFTHPADQPDAEGVFHDIKRYERSLLPIGSASNPYTTFSVKEKGMAPNTPERAAKKWRAFVDTVFEGDEDSAKAYAEQISARAEEIKGSGVAFKETREKALTPTNRDAYQILIEARRYSAMAKELATEMSDANGSIQQQMADGQKPIGLLEQALAKARNFRQALNSANWDGKERKESDAASEKATDALRSLIWEIDTDRFFNQLTYNRSVVDRPNQGPDVFTRRLESSKEQLAMAKAGQAEMGEMQQKVQRAVREAASTVAYIETKFGKGKESDVASEKNVEWNFDQRLQTLEDALAGRKVAPGAFGPSDGRVQDAKDLFDACQANYDTAIKASSEAKSLVTDWNKRVDRARAVWLGMQALVAIERKGGAKKEAGEVVKSAKPTRVADRDPLASLFVDAKE